MEVEVHLLYVYDDAASTHPGCDRLTRSCEISTVTAAHSVDQAINRVKREEFDCVLSAQQLSDDDGLTLLRHLRERDQTLPFILYVANGSEKLASEAISAGVTEYVQADSSTDRIETVTNRIRDAVIESQTQSEYAISELTEATDNVLWLFSADWDEMLYINSAYASIWGQSEATLRANPSAFLDAVHPDDRSAAEAAMEQVSDGESVEIELRVNPKDDYQRRVLVEAEPIHGADGSVQRIAGVSREITKQRTQQQQLEAEQQMTESIFSALPDVLYTFDTAGYLLRWNDQLEKETGYSADEIAEMHVTDFVPDDEVENIFSSFQAIISDHQTVTVESAFETKDGQRIPFEFTGAPIENSDGELRGVTGIGRNISDRKQQQRRFEAVFNNTYQFTGLMSPNGTLLEVNQTALDFAGLTRDELVGEKIWDAYWFQANETAQQTARKAVETAVEGEFFREQITVQGVEREVVIDFSVRPVTDESGDIDLLIPEGRDITRLSEREQQLEVTNRFLRHNLRNKLTVISGYAEIVSNAAADEIRSYGTSIEAAASKLNDTSEMARKIHNLIESDPTPEPTDLDEQIDSAVSIARNRHPKADFSVTVPEKSRIISTPRIHQGLSELLAIIIKSGDSDQPKVTISITRDDQTTVVTITGTDGRISPIEQEVLTGDIEIEQTWHAQGLAVWYVYWHIWYSGGEIRVLKNAQDVEVHLPNAN